jgi:hypothetical protein
LTAGSSNDFGPIPAAVGESATLEDNAYQKAHSAAKDRRISFINEDSVPAVVKIFTH